ncbi:MAG: tyrosine-type recombinase/integrase, partial [SAR324 cluster bacterium]|nr:tyrosine-type recombinase/integrase [SAR324 cluster bacterium]
MKGYAYQLGLDPQSFGGHSLRAGCATYLLDQEIQPAAVQKQMRHKRFDTTQRYNRLRAVPLKHQQLFHLFTPMKSEDCFGGPSPKLCLESISACRSPLYFGIGA